MATSYSPPPLSRDNSLLLAPYRDPVSRPSLPLTNSSYTSPFPRFGSYGASQEGGRPSVPDQRGDWPGSPPGDYQYFEGSEGEGSDLRVGFPASCPEPSAFPEELKGRRSAGTSPVFVRTLSLGLAPQRFSLDSGSDVSLQVTPEEVEESHVEFTQTFYDPFKIKHRRRTTPAQLEILESQFSRNPKPEILMRTSLSAQLEMTPREVQVWFQNRRAKTKKLRERNEESAGNGSDITLTSNSDGGSQAYAYGTLERRRSLPTSIPSTSRPTLHSSSSYTDSRSDATFSHYPQEVQLPYMPFTGSPFHQPSHLPSPDVSPLDDMRDLPRRGFPSAFELAIPTTPKFRLKPSNAMVSPRTSVTSLPHWPNSHVQPHYSSMQPPYLPSPHVPVDVDSLLANMELVSPTSENGPSPEFGYKRLSHDEAANSSSSCSDASTLSPEYIYPDSTMSPPGYRRGGGPLPSSPFDKTPRSHLDYFHGVDTTSSFSQQHVPQWSPSQGIAALASSRRRGTSSASLGTIIEHSRAYSASLQKSDGSFLHGAASPGSAFSNARNRISPYPSPNDHRPAPTRDRRPSLTLSSAQLPPFQPM